MSSRLRLFSTFGSVALALTVQAVLADSPWSVIAISGQAAPGTPYPYKSLTAPAINSQGQISYLGYVQTDIPAPCGRGGTGCTEVHSGAWSAKAGDPTVPLVLQGDVLSGASGPIMEVFSVLTNNFGAAALRVQLPSGQSGIYKFANSSLTPVALPGQPVGDGTHFFEGSISSPYITDSGTMLFSTTAMIPQTQIFVKKYWVSNGASATLGPPFTDSRFGLSDVGKLAFSRITNGQPFPYGLYVGDLQSQQLAIQSGAPAIGTNADFGYMQQPHVNDNGQFVTHITLGPSAGPVAGTGIWTGEASNVSLLAVSGQNAPGTSAQFDEFNYYPLINNRNQIAFTGFLTGSSIGTANRQGLWRGTPSLLDKVVQQGDPAPGTDAQFDRLGLDRSDNTSVVQLESSPFAFNGNGQVAFIAKLTGNNVTSQNDSALWAESTTGELKLVLREGDLLQIAPGDIRQVSAFEMRFGYGTGFNDLGQLAVKVNFVDGSEAILLNNEVAVPEPSSCSLLIACITAMLCLYRRRYMPVSYC